jgi:hypothetical protein
VRPHRGRDYLARSRARRRRCFATPAASAASWASLPPTTDIDALTDFGHAYGMAFQIVDDVLDVVATDEQLGKPAGNDLVEGVYTLLGRRVGKSTTSRMVCGVGEQHHQAVDADAEAAGGRQAVLEGPQVVLVDGHGLVVAGVLLRGLVLEPGALLVGVDQLGEGVAQLAAGHDGLEALGVCRARSRCTRASGDTSLG